MSMALTGVSETEQRQLTTWVPDSCPNKHAFRRRFVRVPWGGSMNKTKMNKTEQNHVC